MTIDHRKLVTLTNYNSPYVEYITSKDGYQVTDTVTRYTKPVFLINYLFGDATLDLDFAADKSIGKLVTFSRASSGTYVDSDGLIKTSPVNYLINSNDLSTWSTAAGTVAGNQVLAPDGTLTGAIVTSTGGGINKVPSGAGSAKVLSAYFKDLSGGAVRVGSTADTNRVFFDSNFNITSQDSNVLSATFEGAPNGWKRLTIVASTAFSVVLIYGSSGETFAVWGAQLEEGTTATDYIPTGATISGAPRFDHDPVTGESLGLLIEEERTNLISLSNQANALQVVGPTTSSDTTEESSPTGSGTVVKLDKNGSGQGFARFNYAAVTYSQTFSVFVKKGTARYVGLRMLSSPSTHTTFDLENNNWVVTTGSTSRGYQQYENGWVRLWIVNDNTDSKAWASVAIVNSGGAESNTVSGTLYAFGFQREQGSFPTSYIPTTGSTVTRSPDIATIEGNKFAKTNLLTYSERFDQSGWVFAVNGTGTSPVLSPGFIAPDGTSTAYRLQCDLNGGTAASNQSSLVTTSLTGFTNPHTNTTSIYVKSNTNSNQSLYFRNAQAAGGEGLVATSEWQRFSITGTVTATIDNLQLGARGTLSDDSIDVLIWGVQIEEGSELTEYTPSVDTFDSRASSATYVDDATGLIKTTPVNEWLNSEDVSSWTDVNTAVVSNNALAPDGTQTADRVSFANITNNWAIVYQGNFTGTYTWSAWIKTADNTTKDIYITWGAPNPSKVRTITATNEWKRFEVLVTPNGENVHLGNARDEHNITPQVWNGGSFYIWGAQIEEGTTATPYIKTGSTISGAARYENGELLLEPARTNIVDNNTSNYSSIWSNALPSGAYNNAGIAPDGTNTAFATTAYAPKVRGQKNYAITADTNDYTFSIFIKSTGGQGQYVTSNTGCHTGDQDSIDQVAYDFSTDTVGHGYSRKIYANGWVRIWKTYTNNNKTLFLTTNKDTTSLDMLFWGAQVEIGSYPSSLIITPSGSNVTRAADVSTSALGVDSWYNQSEGTVFAQCGSFAELQSLPERRIFQIYKSNANLHAIAYRNNNNDDFVMNTKVSNVRLFSPVDVGDPNHFNDKIGYAYSSTGGSVMHQGSAISSSTTDLSVIDADRLTLASGANLNGHIKRLAYFPTRKTDQELIDLTTDNRVYSYGQAITNYPHDLGALPAEVTRYIDLEKEYYANAEYDLN